MEPTFDAQTFAIQMRLLGLMLIGAKDQKINNAHHTLGKMFSPRIAGLLTKYLMYKA